MVEYLTTAWGLRICYVASIIASIIASNIARNIASIIASNILSKMGNNMVNNIASNIVINIAINNSSNIPSNIVSNFKLGYIPMHRQTDGHVGCGLLELLSQLNMYIQDLLFSVKLKFK